MEKSIKNIKEEISTKLQKIEKPTNKTNEKKNLLNGEEDYLENNQSASHISTYFGCGPEQKIKSKILENEIAKKLLKGEIFKKVKFLFLNKNLSDAPFNKRIF